MLQRDERLFFEALGIASTFTFSRSSASRRHKIPCRPPPKTFHGAWNVLIRVRNFFRITSLRDELLVRLAEKDHVAELHWLVTSAPLDQLCVMLEDAEYSLLRRYDLPVDPRSLRNS